MTFCAEYQEELQRGAPGAKEEVTPIHFMVLFKRASISRVNIINE